ncbi:Copper-transporting P-type ATPase [Pirellula sp. SH-Sr6A]|uniref:heavy metal translocating P-type ATPase n=1 Tax=Pirellula sp. SH-Sr6A TaxID=1632865 RepID=UPI00078D4313|nr:heavy metal translocating P-type ATPase [Pirellula sp. SH-Sr6A]AMV30591.1 Copper-transporting P-type ATPase [Pirellula sp. SH-Sr6A]
MKRTEPILEIGVEGMTCAACVRRVENGLNKLPAVQHATVNLATERALVRFDHPPLESDIAAIRATISKLGYEPVDLKSKRPSSAETSETDTLWRMTVGASLFAIPTVVLAMAPMLSDSVMNWMMRWLTMEQWNWVMLLLTVPVQFWFGRRFMRLGAKSLLSTSPDMNALILLGTMAAFLFSALVTVFPNWFPVASRHVYFEASAVVITLVLLGKYLETKSRHQASDAMKVLLKLVPKTATVIRDGQSISIPAEEVQLNDLIEVQPGTAIAVDGVVESGSTYIDESMVTGESVPVAKVAGDAVVAGTINGSGSVRFRATAVGAETTLAKIVAFVESAQASKPRIQGIADRVVAYFVPVVLLIAIFTSLAWLFLMPGGAVDQALIHAVAVLIIACPCAMGLAVPTSVMVGTGKGAQHGILFRSTDAIESLSHVEMVAFDKTGTLTVGKPQLSRLHVLPPFDEPTLLAELALVEQRSEHPLAHAIVEAAEMRGLRSPNELVDFQAIAGAGIDARLSNGDRVRIGSERLMREHAMDVGPLEDAVADAMERGEGYFFAAINQKLAALIVISDPIKSTTPAAIANLRQKGFRIALISGDNIRTASTIADRCGIEPSMVYAEVRPNHKAEVVQSIKREGGRIAFVGDGLNDAPALTVADVGIAMGTGTDLAIESADVIAMSGDTWLVPRSIQLSRAVMSNIRQNLAWAFGYNVLLIPVATGLLQPWTGLSLSPIVAGAAMSLSSFFVVTNALRLRSIRLD